MKTMVHFLVAMVAAALGAQDVRGEEGWPRFRGPAGQGVAAAGNPPISFDARDALWRSEVPGGHSSPSIWGDRIFLSTVADGKLECRAYDRTNGRLIWSRPVSAESLQETHRFSNAAASTPAADSERVVFYVGSYGLLTFRHSGELAWSKPLTNATEIRYGSATSPIIHGDLVILVMDVQAGGSRILAFRKASGELAWETPRPLFTTSWSTPVIWGAHSKPELIVAGSRKLMAYDPETGVARWSKDGLPVEMTTSPAFDPERIYVCSAATGGGADSDWDGTTWGELVALDANQDGKVQLSEIPDDYRLLQRRELPVGHPGRMLPFPLKTFFGEIDTDKDGALGKGEWEQPPPDADRPVLMALRPDASGSAETPKVEWEIKRGMPEVPSPLCYLGRLFVVRDGGIVQCWDASTGASRYQERLGVQGGYYASPIAADGRVYLCSQSGTITVIDARADALKILAQNKLGEDLTATPAIVGRALYVRTARHLYAFQRPL